MKKEKIQHLIITISSIFFILLIWQLIAILSPYSIIPTPLETIEALIIILFQGDNFGYTLFHHIGASLLRVLIGFFYSVIIAIPLGLLMGIFKKIDWATSPIIEIFRPIPPFAWIPFVLVLFGLGLTAQSFVIFIGAFFPILTGTYNGVKETSPIHVDVAKTLGANKGEIIGYVVIPTALPSILVGIRIGIGVGWMCVIAAELVGLNTPLGLGYLIQYSAQFGNFGLTLSIMFVTGLIGFTMTYCLKLFEKRMLRWREELDKT